VELEGYAVYVIDGVDLIFKVCGVKGGAELPRLFLEVFY